jgi:NADH:ubiquinone oxidoreductase subunit C
MDIVIIDRLEMKLIKGKRFNYVYIILSLIYNIRIFISGFIGLFEILPSLCNLYKSAD